MSAASVCLTSEDVAEIRGNYRLAKYRTTFGRPFTIQTAYKNTVSTVHREEAESRWDETGVPKEFTQDIPATMPRPTDPTDYPISCRTVLRPDEERRFRIRNGEILELVPKMWLLKTGQTGPVFKFEKKQSFSTTLSMRAWIESQKKHSTDQNRINDERYARDWVPCVRRSDTPKYYVAESILKSGYLEKYYDRIPPSDDPRCTKEEYNDVLDRVLQNQVDRIQGLRTQVDSTGTLLYYPVLDLSFPWRKAKKKFTGCEDMAWVSRAGKWVDVRHSRKPSVFRVVKEREKKYYWIVDAADVESISASEFQELQQIWEERLEQQGLSDLERGEYPIRILRETTQTTPSRAASIDKITDGERLRKELGLITDRVNDLLAKISAGEPLNEKERQQKHRLLKPVLTITEAWYRAEQELRKNGWVTGLYCLVKFPRRPPRAYFLLAEVPALMIAKQIIAADGDFSKMPYSIVKIAQAKEGAANRVKGRNRKLIVAAFQAAPIRMITFQTPFVS